MAPYTLVRSRGAIALAGLFTVGTAAVLFWDVRHLADITTDHLMTALVLIGTLASGHMVMPQLKAFRLIPAGGLALLFVGGTFYCVTTSAARNVETSVPKVLERLNLNEQRASLERDILEAKADLRKATDAASRECGGGVGPMCRGRMKTQEQADSHYWMLVGRLASMKPAQPANPGLAHAAKVFAILPLTGTPDTIEQALVLLFPFAKALFLEIATLVFWGIGLGHGKKDLPEAKPKIAAKIAGPKIARLRKISRKLPQSSPIRVPTTAMVVDALEKASRPLANYELAALIGCSEGECSRRVARMNGQLHRQRVGHCIMISLANSQSSAR